MSDEFGDQFSYSILSIHPAPSLALWIYSTINPTHTSRPLATRRIRSTVRTPFFIIIIFFFFFWFGLSVFAFFFFAPSFFLLYSYFVFVFFLSFFLWTWSFVGFQEGPKGMRWGRLPALFSHYYHVCVLLYSCLYVYVFLCLGILSGHDYDVAIYGMVSNNAAHAAAAAKERELAFIATARRNFLRFFFLQKKNMKWR